MSSPEPAESVVITGIGLVTPLGVTRESAWRSLLAGERAGVSLDPAQLGAAWRGISPSPIWRGCPVHRTWKFPGEPIVGDALVAAREAVAHANLDPVNTRRWGCVVGASKGGMHLMVPILMAHRAGRSLPMPSGGASVSAAVDGPTDWGRTLDEECAWDKLPAEAWEEVWPDAPATAIAREFNIQGALLSPAAACATGLVSLIRAADLIRDGVCDVVLCGSSDASLQPSLLASYRRLGVMALRGDPPSACRPFDRDREGFLVGEGAAVLVLESRSHAEKRGVDPLAEFVDGRIFSDGAGVAGLDESAEGLSRAIRGVADTAGIGVSEVDLINFHGTGTEQNDRTEVSALSRALSGARLRGKCCAFKGALGHLMGGAGSVETAFSILSLRDQVVPPTANLTSIDPEFAEMGPLSFCSHADRGHSIETVLKTSLGFGGPVAAVLLRRQRSMAGG